MNGNPSYNRKKSWFWSIYLYALYALLVSAAVVWNKLGSKKREFERFPNEAPH